MVDPSRWYIRQNPITTDFMIGQNLVQNRIYFSKTRSLCTSADARFEFSNRNVFKKTERPVGGGKFLKGSEQFLYKRNRKVVERQPRDDNIVRAVYGNISQIAVEEFPFAKRWASAADRYSIVHLIGQRKAHLIRPCEAYRRGASPKR